MDCSFYVVDLHYRSLVKLRQESQIPPPLWRGPSRREHLPTCPTDTPLHIQLPQKVTNSYKLVYICHPARGDFDSGEHSPADSQGVDFHPGPALRKAHSLEHIDIEARRGPASREHSPTEHSGTKDLPGPAHSSKDSIALKESPASGGPDSRDCSTAHPSGLSNPSDKTEEAYSKGHHPPRHISDHPLTTSPRPTSGTRLDWLDSRLTPIKEKDLEPLKKRVLLSQKILPLKLPPIVKQEKIPLLYLHPQKTQIVSHL